MPWEPLWPRDELTRSSFRRRLRHYLASCARIRDTHFLILDDNERLLGGLTLSNVRRGVDASGVARVLARCPVYPAAAT